MNQTMRNRLIVAGVEALKEYGYPSVDKDNIFTDYIYSRFFLGMLKDSLGQGLDEEVNDIIREVEERKSNTL